jgi:hypothetical protein
VALSGPSAFVVFVGCCGCLALALAAANRRVIRHRDLVFDEQPEPAVQTLGLG